MCNDNQLEIEGIRRASNGDRRLLDDFLTRSRGRLRKMVQLRIDRRLQGRIDPSDVVQEAYLEAFSRLEKYLRDPSMPFFVWLRFITTQKLLVLHRRHLQTQARDASREVSIFRPCVPEATSAVLAEQLVGRLSSPSQATLRAERKASVEKALDSMEPIDREVLVLRHFEELTNAETAAALGISRTAANNRYVRALKRLRKALARMPGGTEDIEP